MQTSSMQPKYVKAPKDVTTIFSYSNYQDQENEFVEQSTSSKKWYPTKDCDLVSSLAISIQFMVTEDKP
jgi:hypothetical protein